MTSSEPGAETLWSAADIEQYTNSKIKEATLRWWRHKGVGPKSFRIGGRKVVYKRSDVIAWIEDQYRDRATA